MILSNLLWSRLDLSGCLPYPLTRQDHIPKVMKQLQQNTAIKRERILRPMSTEDHLTQHPFNILEEEISEILFPPQILA